MGRIFKGKHPTFGRGKGDAKPSDVENSPYYWWWQFLRRNEQYLECCVNGGSGPLADLYRDFGDVRDDNFKRWWLDSSRGYHLFNEKERKERVSEVRSLDDWQSHWTARDSLILHLPLGTAKKYLLEQVQALLKERHPNKKLGRIPKESSTAKRQLYNEMSIGTLRILLSVYDKVTAKRRGELDMTLPDIGIEMGFNRRSKFKAQSDRLMKERYRNVMSATVLRYFKEAENIVANTARGEFPNPEPTVARMPRRRGRPWASKKSTLE